MSPQPDWWSATVYEVLNDGDKSAPRGKPIVEKLNVHVDVDMESPVLVCAKRNLNYKFMVAEALWIALGLGDVETLARYNSQMRQFSDDGVWLAGAYGPRLGPQWGHVVDTLTRDKDSRQAVMTIWTPSPRPSKDIPCTISLQFLLRDGAIDVIANMRSSDLWLGLPYDVYAFSQLGNMVAGIVGAQRGVLHMNLGSAHLYEEHWEKAHDAIEHHGFPGYAASESARVGALPGLPPCEVKRVLRSGVITLAEHNMPDPWWLHAKALCATKWSEAFALLTAAR